MGEEGRGERAPAPPDSSDGSDDERAADGDLKGSSALRPLFH